MRFEDYVVARRTRLVEHAVDLGCDPEAAPGLVDGVLAQQRRRIERTADPDPTTYAALERALAGPRTVPWRLLTAVAVALVVVAGAGGAWWLLRPEQGVRVPSFYGAYPADAADALGAVGLQTRREIVRVCQPPGLVLGTDPGAGELAEPGDTVEIRAARPVGCPDDLADLIAGWEFVGFLRGGPAPVFDETVYVVLAGREPAVLPSAAAVDPDRWAGLEVAARALESVLDEGPAYPTLLATEQVPPPTWCGADRPAAAGERVVLRLQVVPRTQPRPECPLTLDLYRDSEGTIDAVVVYSPGPDPG